MKTLRYLGSVAIDFECFSSNCERSRRGAVHLSPGRTVDVTDGEAAAINAASIPVRDVTYEERIDEPRLVPALPPAPLEREEKPEKSPAPPMDPPGKPEAPLRGQRRGKKR